VDDSVPLASQSGQAIDSGIRSHIEDDLGTFCRILPTLEDVLLQKISTKEIALALQHFIEVAWHLESAVPQFRDALHAPITGRHTPERVYRSQFASP
jgi:hypothetical protein